MAKARALKPGDDAGVQDLMYEAARKDLTDLQAEMLIETINSSTGFKLGVLRKTWAKKLKEAKEEAAAAGPGGPGSAGWGPAGASSNASYAGAFGQYCLDEYGLFWRNNKKVWVKIAGPFEILGLARDEDKDHWGKLLRFKNSDELVCEEVVAGNAGTDPHSGPAGRSRHVDQRHIGRRASVPRISHARVRHRRARDKDAIDWLDQDRR